MKVGDPVRIDAPGTGPYPLAGRPAGACHRSAGRRSLFGWRTQPTRFGGFRGCRASLVVPLRKDNNFLGVGTTPFALANRLGFEIGSTRNRPPRRAARNALLPGPIEQVGGKRMYLWRAVDHERAGFRPSVLRWECAPKVRFATPRRLLRGKQVRNCIASPATEGRPLTSRRDGSLLTPRWRETGFELPVPRNSVRAEPISSQAAGMHAPLYDHSTDEGIDVANSQAQAFAEVDADLGNRGYRRDSH